MEGFNGLGNSNATTRVAGDSTVVHEDVEQFLTFMLDDQEYGVDILSVQEIRGRASTTRIPNVPTYIRGVINLRGTIVPVVDLRVRFGMDSAQGERSRMSIVVLKVKHKSGKERAVGIMVDAVSDVYSLTPDMIKDAPEIGGDDLDNDFASGLAIVDDKLIILLEVSRLLTEEDAGSQETK
ncbi:MAG: chemotaxis protein CheW [Myxococcales bacterium]|nr:chemotaxis protein CheW [Myxococcales bacterium]